MLLSILLIVEVFALVQTQDCPLADLVANIDLSSYAQGVWYEIGRYANNLEKNGDCVTANYTKRGDNDYILKLNEVQNGRRIVLDGVLDLTTDDHLKGTLHYVFSDLKSHFILPMSFLAMDYSSYSIKYSCQYNPSTKSSVVLAWIFSRTSQLTDSAKAAVDRYLTSSKFLDKRKFIWNTFNDDSCRVH